MITHEEVRNEIHEMMKKPLNRDCLDILANLVYLDRHFPTFGYKEVEEMDIRNKHYETMKHHEEHHDYHTESTKDEMRSWPSMMKNADGTVGAHWTIDQVRQVMLQNGVAADPVEFWIVMNMIYSDDALVAKKYNVNTPAYFADRAKAWLDDKDAQPDKLKKYFEHIVKR